MFCRLFQFMISCAADADGRLGPLTRRHVLTCARCRRFHQTCRTLAADLRAEAAVLSPASKQLTRGILSNLPGTHRHTPSRRTWSVATAAAACFVVAALIVFPTRQVESPPTPAPPAYAIAAPRVELVRTWARVVEAPLLTEAHNLSGNAQSGLRFLVACLDVRPAQGAVNSPLGNSAPPPVQ